MGWTEAIEDFTIWQTAGGVAPGTIRLRHHYLRMLSLACCPNVGPADVDTDQLLRVLATKGWAAETRKSARGAFRAFYSWAADTGRVSHDPSAGLPPVHVPPSKPRPAPLDVVKAAIERASERELLMIMLALRAGLRRAEIATVHADDLVHEQDGLSLRVRGKGGRVRVIPLHPALAGLLSQRAASQGGWVFPGLVDGHLSPGHVGKLLGRLLGPGWSGHTLRHRFATAAYAVERDLFAVQQLLGHSNAETAARYTQPPDTALRRAVDGVA